LRLNGTSLPFTAAKRTPAQRRTLQLVFQNPDASLNPRRRVGRILGDALLSFERLPRAEIRRRVARVLAEVKLPESYVERFPDQLSGGERQRVAIARGLIVGPDVLICDEVLSALDVSVQAGILELLRGLCRTHNLAILFISHDLAVVRAVADRIIVLRGGRIVTATTAAELLTPPLHPYLHELLSALPGENVLPTSSPPEIAAERIVSRHGVVA
jgi:ABC-type glutathione transport system ATPase component